MYIMHMRIHVCMHEHLMPSSTSSTSISEADDTDPAAGGGGGGGPAAAADDPADLGRRGRPPGDAPDGGGGLSAIFENLYPKPCTQELNACWHQQPEQVFLPVWRELLDFIFVFPRNPSRRRSGGDWSVLDKDRRALRAGVCPDLAGPARRFRGPKRAAIISKIVHMFRKGGALI